MVHTNPLQEIPKSWTRSGNIHKLTAVHYVWAAVCVFVFLCSLSFIAMAGCVKLFKMPTDWKINLQESKEQAKWKLHLPTRGFETVLKLLSECLCSCEVSRLEFSVFAVFCRKFLLSFVRTGLIHLSPEAYPAGHVRLARPSTVSPDRCVRQFLQVPVLCGPATLTPPPGGGGAVRNFPAPRWPLTLSWEKQNIQHRLYNTTLHHILGNLVEFISLQNASIGFILILLFHVFSTGHFDVMY